MRKVVKTMLLVILLFSVLSAQIGASLPPIKVFQDGKELKFDIDPIVENGRTLVELRGIFEAFGVKLTYDSSTKVIKGEHEYNNVSLTIGSNIAQVGNQKVTLEVPAKVINGRTVVPLRFIGEAIRTNVQWNPNERTIVLTTPTDGNKIREKEKETVNSSKNSNSSVFLDGGKNVGEIITEEKQEKNSEEDKKRIDETPSKSILPDRDVLNAEFERHNSTTEKLRNDFLEYESYVKNKIQVIRNEGLVYPYSYETYEKELDELNAEKLNLYGDLSKRMLDDSLPARNKKRELEQKIGDLDNIISDLMESNGRKLQIIGLENLLEEEKLRYEEEMKQENQLHRENMNRLGR